MREGREESVFGAACPFPFTQDSPEIRAIHSSAVRQPLQIAPCRPEIGDTTRGMISALNGPTDCKATWGNTSQESMGISLLSGTERPMSAVPSRRLDAKVQHTCWHTPPLLRPSRILVNIRCPVREPPSCGCLAPLVA